MTEPLPIEGVSVEFLGKPSQKAASRIQSWPTTDGEFANLVETYQHQLVRYAFRRLGRLQDAEDAVQEVFVRAYARMGCPKRIASVAAYLYRMVANACADRLRKRKHAMTPLDAVRDEHLPDGRKGADDEASALEEVRRIDALLRRLPKRQADIVWLRVFDELSFAEAAAVLGCSVPTAKSRFRYGIKKLRVLVRQEWESRP